MKSANIIVSYRFPLYLAFCVWFLGWLVLLKILPERQTLPSESPGLWFDILFWLAIVGVNGLLGPCMVMKYSLKLSLSDDAIQVRRNLGLSLKTYRLRDIKFAAYTHTERRKMAAAEISFNDGNSVHISGFASQFDSLVDFISQRVSISSARY